MKHIEVTSIEISGNATCKLFTNNLVNIKNNVPEYIENVLQDEPDNALVVNNVIIYRGSVEFDTIMDFITDNDE